MGTDSTNGGSVIRVDDFRLRFEETTAAQLKQQVDQNESMNSRQLGAALIAALLLEVFIAIFLFIFYFFAFVWSNLRLVAVLIGFIVLTLTMRSLGDELINAVNTGDTGFYPTFVSYVNPVQQIWNVGINLFSIGVVVWNLTFPVMVFLVQLAFDLLVPIMIFCIAQFGDYFMAMLTMVVQFVQIAVQCFVSIAGSSNLSGGMAEGAFGGTASSELFGLDPFSQVLVVVSNLIRAFAQITMRGFTAFVSAVGQSGLQTFDFIFNVVLKYIGIIVKTVLWLVGLFNPGQLLNYFIFVMGQLIYSLGGLFSGNCFSISGITKSICAIMSTVAGWVNTVTSKLGLGRITGGFGCDGNSVNNNCPISPTNLLSNIFGGFGVGICDASECVSDVIAIIGQVSQQMPLCSDWVANSQSTIQCMNIVYQFSQSNSTSTASASIDSISKELCFVLTATVIATCQSSQPPFSFSYTNVADNVCIYDKSGLSPPLPPFNDNCACIYDAPLCNAECCNQYSLHVIGQVKSYVGATQCGTILTEFPEGFWCQYQGLNGTEVPPHTDLTFSSDWCAAYQLVIYPACSMSSPTITLNALDLSTLIPAYSQAFCNSTINQPGVCVRIDTQIDPGIFTFQYEQTLVVASGVLGTNNGNNYGFTGGNIVTTPSLGDTTQEILQMDIEKYYCYYFALIFNTSNPTILMRKDSVLATTSAYCDQSLMGAYGGFSFTDQIFHILRTPAGALTPVNLIGLPPNVLVFGSIVGVNSSLTEATNSSTFGATTSMCTYSTGLSPTELNDQQNCVSSDMTTTYTTTNSMGQGGVQAGMSLQTNSDEMQPIDHLSGLTPIQPNATNYQDQATEQEQTNAATTVATNWQTIPSSQMQPETTTYRTTYVTGETILTRSYVGKNPLSISTPEEDNVGRTILSVDTDSIDECKTVECERKKRLDELLGLLASFGKTIEEIKEDGRVAWKNIVSTAVYQDPRSAKDEVMFSERRARRGHAIVTRTLQTIDRELTETMQMRKENRRVDARETFKTTRKILGVWNVTGTQIADMINSAFDKIADNTFNDQNVDAEQLRAYFTKEALVDAEFLFKHTTQVYIPTIVNFIYHTNFSTEASVDYSFGTVIDIGGGITVEGNGALFKGGTTTGTSTDGSGSGSTNGGTPTCVNTWAHPLQCCTPGATPYECCYGLEPLCIPMLPSYLFIQVTSAENAAVYVCPGFNTFIGWWKNFIRSIFTALEKTITSIIPQTGFLRDLLDKITYPNEQYPPNTVQCLIFWSWPLFVGLAGLFLLYIFFLTQFVTELMLIVFTRMEVVTATERIQTLKQDMAIAQSQIRLLSKKSNRQKLRAQVKNRSKK